MSPGTGRRQVCQAAFAHGRMLEFLRGALRCDSAEAPGDGQCGRAHLVDTLAPHVRATVSGHPPRSGSCFSSFLPFHGQPFQLWFLLQTCRSTVLNEASCTELIKTRRFSAEGLGRGMSAKFSVLKHH